LVFLGLPEYNKDVHKTDIRVQEHTTEQMAKSEEYFAENAAKLEADKIMVASIDPKELEDFAQKLSDLSAGKAEFIPEAEEK